NIRMMAWASGGCRAISSWLISSCMPSNLRKSFRRGQTVYAILACRAVNGCRLHAQVALQLDVVAVEQFFAAHVLVARGHVALAEGVLARPARQGVLVETDQGVVAADPFPRRSPPAEGIDLVPAQVPPPAADGVPRGAGAAAAEHGEAPVLHLVQVEQALQADDGGEHTGQQPAR